MTGTIRPARTDTFEHTISGLLTKRAELFHDTERIRDRRAEINNDVAALDRVPGSLGDRGDLDAAMPRSGNVAQIIFGGARTSHASALRSGSAAGGDGLNTAFRLKRWTHAFMED